MTDQEKIQAAIDAAMSAPPEEKLFPPMPAKDPGLMLTALETASQEAEEQRGES